MKKNNLILITLFLVLTLATLTAGQEEERIRQTIVETNNQMQERITTSINDRFNAYESGLDERENRIFNEARAEADATIFRLFLINIGTIFTAFFTAQLISQKYFAKKIRICAYCENEPKMNGTYPGLCETCENKALKKYFPEESPPQSPLQAYA